MPIAGVNCQPEMTGMVPAEMPVLATIHDDFPPSQQYAGLNPYVQDGIRRVHHRLMSPRSQFFRNLPDGSDLVCGNETEQDWPTWQLGWIVDEVRPYGHGLRIHHPAPNTDGQFPYDSAIAAACDVLDAHAGIGRDGSGKTVWFVDVDPVHMGKPVWITELEVDPAAPDLMDAIPDAMADFLERGFQVVLAWGIDGGEPDVLFHPDVLSRIAALGDGHIPVIGASNVSTPTNPDQESQQDSEIAAAGKKLSEILDQDALINEGFRRIAQGKINGAGGLAAVIVGLQGGTDIDFTPIPDFQ